MAPPRKASRDRYPSREIDPENFLDNDEVEDLLARKDEYTFKQEDWIKLLTCVHCNECGTSKQRAELNHKFLQDGNKIPGLEEMLQNFRDTDTPYDTNEMRIKRPEGIPEESTRLFFMGCLSTIKIPKFTEHALELLLKEGVDFTILDTEACCGYPVYASGAFDEFERLKKKNIEVFKKYEEVLCLCPACYFIFSQEFPDIGVKFTFISDYMRPAREKKSGKVGIQHLCQLKNRGRPEVQKQVDVLMKESGYDVEDIPMWCCGGGIGYMHRTDLIDRIAEERMKDFEGCDYITTYCPGCYWILKRFRRKIPGEKKPRLKDTFALLL